MSRRPATTSLRAVTFQRFVCIVLAAVLAATVALVAAPVAPSAGAAGGADRPAAHLTIGADGTLSPSSVSVVAGQTVLIDNDAGVDRRVVADDGTFDSGPIPSGGTFALTLSAPGAIPFTSPGEPELHGVIDVGLTGLEAPATTRVTSAIPDVTAPEATDLAPHPTLVIDVSRTRLVVAPSATATVGPFNELLAANHLTIIGGLTTVRELIVATADPGDHSAVEAAAKALRASNLVAGAALDVEVEPDALPRPVPTPSSEKDPLATWNWTDPAVAPTGAEGNWGLRDIRAPQAWNLLDTARTKNNPATVAAIENWFAPHDDVPLIEPLDLCSQSGFACASPKPEEVADNVLHSQHVTGIIGARYDNTADATHSVGVSGVDPVARLYGVVARSYSTDAESSRSTYSGLMTTIDKMLAMTDAGGKLAGLRAINISLGNAAFNERKRDEWWKVHPFNQPQYGPTQRCGIGKDDDDHVAAIMPCTPSMLDEYRQEVEWLGKAMIPVLQTAAAKSVIIVKSAGNERDLWCLSPSGSEPTSSCSDGMDIMLSTDVHAVNDFVIAADLYPTKPAPLLVVENHQADGAPHASSQLGGDISAPGTDIVSATNGTYGYAKETGTSMAAPFVTGSLAYLFSVAPSADWRSYRAALLSSARPATKGGANHLDLYAAAVKLNMLKSAADLNDWSADGDRRVFRSDSGTPVGLDTTGSATVDGRDGDLGPQRAQPDGKVDMRDFRAMRDAWLQTCLDGSAGTQAGAAPACPAQISLDGPAAHDKKDGNGDRCVTTATSNCQLPEAAYSRFDTNGDGHLSVYDKAAVAIDAQGRPVTTTQSLTDLEVLQTYFETNVGNTEGWTKAELPNLLVSADLDVRLGELWAAGATSVKVTTTVEGQPAGKVRTFTKPASGTGGGIVTVPVSPDGSTVELLATATGPDGTPIIGTPVEVGMAPGDDAVAAPCVAHLELTLGAPALLPGKETGLTAQIEDCSHTSPRPELSGRDVTFSVVAAGDQVPVITSAPTASTDQDGAATATLRAGDGEGTFQVKAKVDLGGGNVLEATEDVKVSPVITMAYKWRETLDQYDEHGITRFAGQPDCTTTGASYCLDGVHATIEPATDGGPAYVLERSGTLTATKDGVTLSERIDEGSGVLRADFTWEDLVHGGTDDGFKRYWFGIAAPDQFRYTDTPVPVTMTPSGDDVVVDNLRFLATLGYRGVITYAQARHLDPKEIGIPSQFFLTPRTDGSSFMFAPSPYAAIRFSPANASGVAGYDWCGTNTTDLTEPPGYYAAGESPWVIGATDVTRDTQYDPGDQPLLTTTGTLRFDIAFATTVSVGGEPPEPELPTCDGPNPPDAEFKVINPAPIEEGEAVQFVDRSEDVDGDLAQWAWDFGGTGASTVQDPTYSAGFPDEGTYPVRLTVTDAQGHAGTIVHDVTVVNGAPSVDVAKHTVLGTAQIPLTFVAYSDDPGEHDRQSLKVTLSSTNTAFGAVRSTTQPAGEVRFSLAGLPAGEYPLTVTVADDQNATATATAVLYVAPTPPQPVNEPYPPVIVHSRGCTAPLPLDEQEADLLARINAQRVTLGATPLVLSTELTSAAQAHARDLLATGAVSGTGSDGLTATDRARAAGYTKGAALDARVADAPDAAGMFRAIRAGAGVGSWFTPATAMLGIARVTDGSSTRWVVVAGSELDCDEQPPAEGSAPVAAVSVPTAPVPEGITFAVTDASTDPDGDLAARSIDWGDGSGEAGLRHRYADDGTYTVTLTVADEAGHVSTATAQVVVTSTAPEVTVYPTTLVAGETGLVSFSVVDLAEADRPLTLQLSSNPPGLAPAEPYTASAGSQVYKVTPPVAGGFDVTLTATDPDGATSTTTRHIDVVDPPAPQRQAPVNVTLPAAPSCATGMVVRGQVAEQLALLNEYRARHGAGPLVVVPQLTAAAEVHATDMATKRFFAHQGSDGSMPQQRAAREGYQGLAGENLGLRSENPAGQLAGWIMSPGHHANLLDPRWTAIGIAAENGPDGVLWVNVFGNQVTCPPANQTPPSPIVLQNPAVARPAGTLGEGGAVPADTGPINPVAADTELFAPTEPEAAATTAAMSTSQVVADATTLAAATSTVATAPTALALAMVVSDRTPDAGQVITVANRTRDHGVPRVATMSTSSMPASGIAADSVRRLSVLDPGALRIDLSAVTPAGQTLTISMPLTVAGDPLAPAIAIAPLQPVVSGELLPLAATVTEPGGAPASGRGVRFTLDGASVTTATGDDGVATATIRADVARGTWTVRAVVLNEAGAVTASAETTVEVADDNAPVADAGGPYTSNVGDALTLDASGSYDADGEGLTYSWDLDGDGQFDDADGAKPQVEWPTLQQVVCGGGCDSDVAHPIALRATDPRGASGDATATITFTRDFSIAVSPQTLTIVPGSANTFVVDVTTTSGFTGAVTLSAAGLPAGATAKFEPAVVTPGGQSAMTVTLPADVGGAETIDLAVTGTSGPLVRTASSVVDVVFGLPPRCSTSVEGTVVDAETGLPLAGVALRVSAADGTRILVTDGNGRWRIAAASPSTTNQPGPVTRRLELDGYWTKNDLKATATCDVPMVLADRLTPIHTVHLVGRVHVGQQDPQNLTRITPTDAVAPGTTFAVTNGSTKLVEATPVGSDGHFEIDLPLSPENKPANYTVQGIAPGYWANNFGVPAVDGDSPTADIVIIPKCTARLTGGRVVDISGKPVPGVKVSSSTAGKSTVSGPDGSFRLDADLTLGVNNMPASGSISGVPPLERPDLLVSSANFPLGACGDVVSTDLVMRQPPVIPPLVPNDGNLTGTVTDAESGLPVGGATVNISGRATATTATDGTFVMNDVLIGYGVSVVEDFNVTTSLTGYWSETNVVRLVADETRTMSVALTPKRTGTVSGVVHDQVTGAPLGEAKVTVASQPSVIADGEGRFTVGNVPLGQRNAPNLATVSATLAGYWPRNMTVQVTDGATAVADVAMLRECATAEVRGIVVNAVTRAPISGAKVGGSSLSAVTGPDGRFAIAGIKMKTNNTPWSLTLTASADGFVSQSRTVNVFCGARIEVGFGSLPASPGVLTGTVTDAASGAPLADVFVGTGFGGAVRTAADGTYRIEGVPTNDDGTPIDWEVSVLPDAGDAHLPATATVSVLPGATVDTDFALELPAPPNQPPAAVLTTPPAVAEGSPVTLDASASADPDGATLAFAWDLDGDGSFDDGTAPTASFVPPVAGSYPVVVRVTDVAGVSAIASAIVVAQNVPPAVDAGGDVTLDVAGHLVRGGSFTDPGADTFVATADFGDGTGVVALVVDGHGFGLDHVFAAGTWAVTVEVCDGHGGCGQDSFAVTVPALPPNQVPVAVAVSAATVNDRPVAVTLAGADPDGDAITYAVTGGPAHGTLSGTAPNLTYTPASDFVGTDTFTFTVSDGRLTSAPATATITVTASAVTRLLISDDTRRSVNVRQLDGQTLRNGVPMYVFVGPAAVVPQIKQVRFWLDDPQRKGTPFSLETAVSWDFARTAANGGGCTTCADSPAHPFESNLLPLGTHTISAVVEYKDGRPQAVLSATFTVAGTTPHSLQVSSKADRSGAVALQGAKLSGKRYIFLGTADDAIAGQSSVRFVLDGKAVITEGLVPYDLAATASNGTANALDTKTLSTGSHTLVAFVQLPEGVTYTYTATFTVTR